MTASGARPVLYSFRRCPYAMRARMALGVSGQRCALREVVLKDKPAEMIAISPKATVPVLQLPTGEVMEESLEIMLWALNRHDPEDWLTPGRGELDNMLALIETIETDFKPHLDRYKYATRHDGGADSLHHRTQASSVLVSLNDRLRARAQLFGAKPALADFAIFPFVRQFANTDPGWFQAQPWPALIIWLDGHVTSERFRSMMKKFAQWRTGDKEPVFPAQPG